ncbi:uncharacterized protein LOC128229257 [Mya arenaria]|uniref:uncharacterized protein LOC128229257 n=1 Tax=Mya arenaria TaxID=6604 RepID=UPI0022E78EAE|nr:uncharacterized protein LOC128229257 [Mya arenaria]
MDNRRRIIKSAPTLSCLPRLDSRADRRELISPGRRQATATLRRDFFRRLDVSSKADDERKRKMAELRSYKAYLDRVKLLYDSTQIHNQLNRDETLTNEHLNKGVLDEVTKPNLPERLPVCVTVRVGTSQPRADQTGDLRTDAPLFYTVRRLQRGRPTRTAARHFFIGRDWASERISIAHMNKHAPEIDRRAWIG